MLNKLACTLVSWIVLNNPEREIGVTVSDIGLLGTFFSPIDR